MSKMPAGTCVQLFALYEQYIIIIVYFQETPRNVDVDFQRFFDAK